MIVAYVALQASAFAAPACELWSHQPMTPAQQTNDNASMSDITGAMQFAGAARDLDMPGMPDGTTPCEHGMSPESCIAMPSCMAVIITVSLPAADHTVSATRVAITTTLAPELASLPPELPPPRA